ncbi:Tubulin-specific chaperone A [Orchesella cincta]|uniref:Tubulin-specific chaperone A n=1 Tax=Orchesella cincta TaxID=48709 RepID=A0A1D2NE92_ORCCI|nr:Tubulin-specific chaperone A [Orchesella cincta]
MNIRNCVVVLRGLKTLKIKTGVVKRYTKEKQSYEKEASQQRAKIEKFKQEGKDEHFMRQQDGCLKESEMMVPEVQRQLLKGYEELKAIVEEQKGELGQTGEYKTAVQILDDAKAHLPDEST